MTELTGYAASPLGFIFRYVRLRPISHAAILGAVLAAVACAICTQYGIKFLVDTLAAGTNAAAWTAFLVLGSLIAADNLLWRVASWIANYAFVGVTVAVHGGRTFHTNMFSAVNTALEVAVTRLVNVPGRRSEK